MKRTISTFVAGVASAVLFSGLGTAQAGPNGVGPRLGIELDDSNFYLGVEGRFGVARFGNLVRLDIRPSFDYYFVDSVGDLDVTVFQISGDVLIAFDVKNDIIEPYGIGGLSVIYSKVEDFDSETDIGVNIGGGVKFLHRGRIQPFAELRITLSDGNLIQLGGGVLFMF